MGKWKTVMEKGSNRDEFVEDHQQTNQGLLKQEVHTEY